MGIFGGYLVGVQLIGVDAGAFWSQMQAAVDLRDDIVNGVIKSVVFGIAVTLIAVFEGYDAPPTAEGVSRATTRTVVTSSLAILALDFVLTAFMFTRRQSPMNRSTIDLWVGIFVAAGFGGAAVSRAEGRQPRARSRTAETYQVEAQVRQHRRPEGARAGEERRRGGRPRRRHPLRQRELPGASSRMSARPATTSSRGTPSATILTSGLLGEQYIGLEAGGDGEMLGERRPHRLDAVGGGAGEPDRPVPVQQGGRGQAGRPKEPAK